MKKKRMSFYGIVLLCTSIILYSSCANNKKESKKEEISNEEVSINQSIAWIESIRTGVQYPSKETIDDVTNIIGERKIESPEMDKTYNEADSIWNEFKDLCSKKEYKKAYDLYYNNEGSIMGALKSTTARYVFYTEVLSELDRMYDPTHALEKMVSNLNLNLLMTSAVIEMSGGKTVPAHFSDLFMMCIEGNKRLGNIAKVNEIIETYTPMICQIEGKSEEEVKRMIDAILETDDTGR